MVSEEKKEMRTEGAEPTKDKASESEVRSEDAGSVSKDAVPREQTKASDDEIKKEAPAFFKPSRGRKVESEFIERVIRINRVSKVVKGGKNFSFSALVVTGDGKGQVGVGLGKSNEVVEAIKKGTANANKSFITVKMAGDTIPHEIIGTFKASRVIMKPAGPGTGVIAGGPVRAMCDAAGIKNILTKTLGSRNSVNVVKATADGFKRLRLARKGLGVTVESDK